ncbi:zinc finger C2HC domain-containing protein 1A isoform X2 [Microcaecilia unicolor]|uniref:Zinc finger C2HC domain-containing protein 1A n=1 Tax=Microcaecilia unicolor TaxID=1415580 RepID=A0A6P7Z4L9_9AMPH|nr:zinc finger C2HC domain-containing protein 1A isoform X2 [Microcaecilia unicolor]
MEELEEKCSVQQEQLLPCKICGRTFFHSTLKKHIPICQKMVTKKRKTFDSSRQRAEGTDITTVKPVKPRVEPPKKPSNWRRKHEEFLATMRAVKGLGKSLKEGGELPPPPPPSYDPDYIQCPFCQRRFNENAAERHINFCKEQAARINNKSKLSVDTKGKTPARTQYKPPALKKTNPSGLVPAASSRLPQPSNFGKATAGVLTSNVPASGGSAGYKLQNSSPARKNPAGVSSPQSGGTMKSRTPTSVARTAAPGVDGNKRKTYNPENYSRSDGKVRYETGDHTPLANGGNTKGSGKNASEQFSKFCHECGTRYPVECAKFCCECGVKRMIL